METKMETRPEGWRRKVSYGFLIFFVGINEGIKNGAWRTKVALNNAAGKIKGRERRRSVTIKGAIIISIFIIIAALILAPWMPWASKDSGIVGYVFSDENVQKELAASRLENEGLQGELTASKLKTESLLTQIQDVQKKLADSKSEIESLKVQIQDLQKQLADPKSQNASLLTQIQDLQKQLADSKSQNASLLTRIKDLEKQLTEINSNNPLSFWPAPPDKSQLITWTDVQARDLCRVVYPGTDKFRDMVFNGYASVYPLSWYKENLAGVAKISWPIDLATWYDIRYPDMAKGYVETYGTDGWRAQFVLPAHENGVISLYYLVNNTWVKAGSEGDSITPLVMTITLNK